MSCAPEPLPQDITFIPAVGSGCVAPNGICNAVGTGHLGYYVTSSSNWVSYYFDFSVDPDCNWGESYTLQANAAPIPNNDVANPSYPYLYFNESQKRIRIYTRDTTVNVQLLLTITGSLDYNPNPNPALSGPVQYGNEELEVTLVIDNIPCVARFIQNDGIDDMIWTVRHNEPDTVQVLGEYLDDNGNQATCGNRRFELTQEPQDQNTNAVNAINNYVWLDKNGDGLGSGTAGARTLTVNANAPSGQNPWEIVTTDRNVDQATQDAHRYQFKLVVSHHSYQEWYQTKRVINYWYVTIDAYCHYTNFNFVSFAMVGWCGDSSCQPAITKTMDDITDMVSKTTTAFGGDGLSYCGPRGYSYNSGDVIVTNAGDAGTKGNIVTFQGSSSVTDSQGGNRLWTLTPTDKSQFGTYSVPFTIDLKNQYPGFVPKDFAFDAQILPDCAKNDNTDTVVWTWDPAIYNMEIPTNGIDQQTFVPTTFDQSSFYSSYCGDVTYSMTSVSPAAAGLVTFTYDDVLDTRTIDIDASGIASGVYTVTLRTSLIDFTGTWDEITITVTVQTCPGPFAKDLFPGDHLPTANHLDQARVFFVIGVDDGNVEGQFPFTFPYDAATCTNMEPYYYGTINGTDTLDDEDLTDAIGDPVPWITIDQADPDAPMVVVDLTSDDEWGIHDIQLTAKIINMEPNAVATDQIDFKLFAYPSQCLNTRLNDKIINDMAYVIEWPYAPLDYAFDEFTDTITQSGAEDCGPRLYTLTGAAVDKDIVTVDSATNTLTVQTRNPTYVTGTPWVVDFRAELEDHPWLTEHLPEYVLHPYTCDDTSTGCETRTYGPGNTKQFSITITSPCETTIIQPNPDFEIHHLHQLGTDPEIWQFRHSNDSYSLDVMGWDRVNYDEGWRFCYDRLYTITGFTSGNAALGYPADPSYPAYSVPPVTMDEENRLLYLEGIDETYVGVHTVTLDVTLPFWSTFVGVISDEFVVFILPSCTTTTFSNDASSDDPVPYEWTDVVVNAGMLTQPLPVYRSSVDEQSEEWGFAADICGEHAQWLENVDNSTSVPDFIEIVYSELTGAPELRVQATEDDDVGYYEFYFVTTLWERAYMKWTEPRYDFFNVTVTEFPYIDTNDLPYPEELPFNVTLLPGEDFEFYLAPFDPDFDEVTTQFQILTLGNQATCQECFHYDLTTQILQVTAKESLQGLTTEFMVTYKDKVGYAEFVWSVTVEELPIDVPEDNEGEDGFEGTEDPTVIDEVPKEPIKTKEQEMLEEFIDGPFGFVLSGLVYPQNAQWEDAALDALRELPFPVPYVTNFTREGYVTVEFSHDVEYRDDLENIVDQNLIEVYLTVSRNEEAFVSKGISDQANQLNIDDLLGITDDEEVSGGEQGDNEPEEDSASDSDTRRRLDEIAEEAVVEKARQQEVWRNQTTFYWHIEDLRKSKMLLKLDFAMPEQISAWQNDNINLKFNISPEGDAILMPAEGFDMLQYNYTTDLYVPKLADPSTDNKWASLYYWGYAVDYVSLTFGLICVLWWLYNPLPLYYFFSYLNYLQLLVHISMTGVSLPQPLVVFFAQVFPWATLTRVWPFDSLLFEHTRTSPFSMVFDQAGYHGMVFTENVGTLSYILAVEIFLAMVCLALMALCRCRKCKKVKEWVYGANFISRMFWRTCIQLYFVFTICVIVAWLPARAPFARYASLLDLEAHPLGDSVSSAYGHAVLAVLAAFTLVLLVFGMLQGRYAASQALDRQAAHASEVLFTLQSTRQEIIKKYALLHVDGDHHGHSLREQVKEALGKDNKMERYLALQELANPKQSRTQSNRLAVQWKLKRIQQLEDIAEAQERAWQKLNWWHGAWADELRHGLKSYNWSALLWVPLFVARRLILVASFFWLPSTLGAIQLFAGLSLLTLAYLVYVRPYTDRARNYFEIFNEALIYVISFLALCLQGMQGKMVDAHQYNEIGWSMVLIIQLAFFVQWGFLFWGCLEPFREAMRSRQSSCLGRWLRYCYKVKLPDQRSCTCPCCTIAEEESQSAYPRTFFFEIMPEACALVGNADDTVLPAYDYSTGTMVANDDSRLSNLDDSMRPALKGHTSISQDESVDEENSSFARRFRVRRADIIQERQSEASVTTTSFNSSAAQSVGSKSTNQDALDGRAVDSQFVGSALFEEFKQFNADNSPQLGDEEDEDDDFAHFNQLDNNARSSNSATKMLGARSQGPRLTQLEGVDEEDDEEDEEFRGKQRSNRSRKSAAVSDSMGSFR